MESLDDWILGLPPVSRRPPSLQTDLLTYFQQHPLWAWLSTNQSVVLSIIVLVASVLLSSNILDLLVISTTTLIPDGTRLKLWDALITISPAPLLFWLEDSMARSRRGNRGAAAQSQREPAKKASKAAARRENRHQAKSDALANTLGLGPDGRRRDLASTYGKKIGRLAQAASKSDPNRPRGLMNSGNWCYQNSILQGLSSLDSMAQYLEDALREAAKANGVSTKAQEKKLKTVLALRDLIGELREPAGNRTYLQTTPVLKQIQGFGQQDAQEYLLKLLDTIEGELKNAGVINTKAQLALTPPRASTPKDDSDSESGSVSMKRKDSNASNRSDATVTSRANFATGSDSRNFHLPLEALVAERKACKVCGFSEGISLDPTCCVILSMPFEDLPKRGKSKAVYDMETLLNNYCQGEVLSGIDCSNCTLLRLRDKLVQKKEALAHKHKMKTDVDGEDTAVEEEDDDEEGTDMAELETRLAAIEQALATKTFDDDTLDNKCKVQKGDYVRSDKAKQIAFASAPPALAIQIARSGFSYYTVKDDRRVHFPPVLDFSPWYLGNTSSASAHSIAADSLQGKDRAIVQELAHQPQRPVYRLRCAVMHRGTAQSGHYFCYRKQPSHKVAKATRPMPVPAPMPVPVPTPKPASKARGDRGSTSPSASKEGTPCDFDDDSTTVVGSEYGMTPDRARDSVDDAAMMAEAEDNNKPPLKKRKRAGGEGEQQKAPAPPVEDEQSPWWHLSDVNVHEAYDGDVFSQPQSVYMLFYDRVSDEEAEALLAAAARDADDAEDAEDSKDSKDVEVDEAAEDADDDRDAEDAEDSKAAEVEVEVAAIASVESDDNADDEAENSTASVKADADSEAAEDAAENDSESVQGVAIGMVSDSESDAIIKDTAAVGTEIESDPDAIKDTAAAGTEIESDSESVQGIAIDMVRDSSSDAVENTAIGMVSDDDCDVGGIAIGMVADDDDDDDDFEYIVARFFKTNVDARAVEVTTVGVEADDNARAAEDAAEDMEVDDDSEHVEDIDSGMVSDSESDASEAGEDTTATEEADDSMSESEFESEAESAISCYEDDSDDDDDDDDSDYE